MEWLDSLRGTIVGLDTAPLIYFIEAHPRYLPLVRPFFEAVERGDLAVVTSTLTLTEVLVHPWRHRNEELIRQYSRILLHADNLRTIPVLPEIAAEAARIRAVHGLKVPDAIQIATFRFGGATSFLTNDAGMASIQGLQVLCLDRLPPSNP
ncbi:MAG: type II toxin-antitoxin system VapC family toxin [Acidobacteriaceae bacterium]